MNSLTASTTLGTFNKMRCEENRERGELRREVIYDGGREKVQENVGLWCTSQRELEKNGKSGIVHGNWPKGFQSLHAQNNEGATNG